jgi:hypothetical protein
MNKYLKYKLKYLELKGGAMTETSNKDYQTILPSSDSKFMTPELHSKLREYRIKIIEFMKLCDTVFNLRYVYKLLIYIIFPIRLI